MKSLIFSALVLLSTIASASPVFETANLLSDQSYLSIIPTLKDKGLVCDRSSIYWSLISDLKVHGSGTYRLIGDETGLFQVTVRDQFANEIPVYDGANRLLFSQMGPADYVRGFQFEIRLEDMCIANRNRHFTADEFLAYVRTLQISSVTIQSGI